MCAPLGLTGSRPAKVDGSDFMAVARIHAGGFDAALAPSSSVNTTAHAPSEDGQDSRKCNGSHIIGDSLTFSMVMSANLRCAYGFLAPLSRSLTATFQPTSSGAPERRM